MIDVPLPTIIANMVRLYDGDQEETEEDQASALELGLYRR